MKPDRYQFYLRCDCWMKQLRCAALLRAHYLCEVRIRCSGAKATQVHHDSYRNLGNESPFDIRATCAACHRALHNIREPLFAANDNEPLLPLFGQTDEVA